jgi:hypothetical protein
MDIDMDTNQWNKLLNSELPPQRITITVAMAVRTHLVALTPGMTLSTNELIEALYPRAIADQSLAGDNARTQLYKIVGKLAHDKLSDCCMKGEVKEKKYMGREVRPWIWFCPEDTDCCAVCGQPLPLGLDDL